MAADAQNLLYIGHRLDKLERDIDSLAFCFDTYLEFVYDGRGPTDHMDASKAIQQLESAICRGIGRPNPNE
jgi:hypothetical protein